MTEQPLGPISPRCDEVVAAAGQSSRPGVLVVVVSYNTADLLADCLASVAADSGDVPCTVQTVVVDNASVDHSVEVAERAGATVIRLKENTGFAAACNVGAATVDSDYVMLLNPDAVLEPGSMSALLTTSQRHPSAGLVGGIVRRPDGALDRGNAATLPTMWGSVCFALGVSTAFGNSRLFNPDVSRPSSLDREFSVDAVAGSLALIPRRVWELLEGFDETFFMYGEDIDLCARAQRAGFSVWVTPGARIVHVNGASSSSADKWIMLLRGKVSYFQRNWTPRRAALGIRLLLAGTWLRSRVSRGGRSGAAPWTNNWHVRSQWVEGWPAADDPRRVVRPSR